MVSVCVWVGVGAWKKGGKNISICNGIGGGAIVSSSCEMSYLRRGSNQGNQGRVGECSRLPSEGHPRAADLLELGGLGEGGVEKTLS